VSEATPCPGTPFDRPDEEPCDPVVLCDRCLEPVSGYVAIPEAAHARLQRIAEAGEELVRQAKIRHAQRRTVCHPDSFLEAIRDFEEASK